MGVRTARPGGPRPPRLVVGRVFPRLPEAVMASPARVVQALRGRPPRNAGRVDAVGLGGPRRPPDVTRLRGGARLAAEDV